MRGRAAIIAVSTAAIATFMVVQDRVTMAGARDYVMRQRAAAVGEMPAVTVDEVMRPAVTRSVRLGLLWGGVVLTAGGILALSAGRSRGVPEGGRGQSRR
jgi:hypothetical protein